MSCGWAKTELSTCERDITKLKLPIQGGSPEAEMTIQDQDINSKRSGIKALTKMFSVKVSSVLTVSFKPHNAFPAETKFHADLLASTCLIQNKLVPFISGYRNRAGEELLSQIAAG